MSYFQTLKASITCRDAAEKYGLEVSRSGMARCPFHDDHTPSLKVDERYYCFGCHAQGDVIDLTARLLGISNYSAAKQLALDFGIYPRPPTEERIHKPKPPPVTENFCLSVLMEYYRLQRFWKQQYAPGSPGEPFHEKFVEACHRSSFITHLIDEMMDADPWRRKQVMDVLTEDNRIHRLQKYVMKMKMEELKKILRENKSLKTEVGGLEQQLAASTKSVLDELQKKQRMLELEEKERLLANIPPEIVEKYNKKYKEETALEV